MTPAALAAWKALESRDPRRHVLVLDLTEEDLQSAPLWLVPGLIAAQASAIRQTPYQWLDPWEGR